MTLKPKCTCGLLARLAEDPKSKICCNPAEGFFLNVSNSLKIDIQFCPFCGGHDKVRDVKGTLSFFQGGKSCSCNQMVKLAEAPDSAITYDSRMNEYHSPRCIIYYCLCCGGRMPESKRSDLFIEPDSNEMKDFRSKVRGLKTLEEVIATIGSPDWVVEPPPLTESEKAIYGGKSVKKQISFTTPWKTLTATVCLMEDGELQFSASGKQK
jgi:hypothetical protein